jgi:hypothetical protein
MPTRDESDTPASGAVSRREFFAGAGMAAGAIAALGSAGGLTYAPAAQAALLRDRKYFSSYVALELDGAYAGNLVSAEGGEPVLVPPDPIQQVGATKYATTATTLRYETMRLRLGDMSAAVFKWIGDTSRAGPVSKNAAVITYDLEGRELYRLDARGVRPTAIATDGLDSASKELLRFNLTLVPTSSSHVLAAKTNSAVKTGLKSKALLASNFRLYIQGLESTTVKARGVDSFGLQARADGILVPTPLKFTLSFRDAAPMFTWMNDTLAGKTGARDAELQFLSADLAKVAASAKFSQLTILRVSCPAQGNDSIQSVDVECAPASLTFDMGDLLT